MRSSIAIVSVLVLATGCRLSPAGKSAVVGAGVISTIGGVAMMAGAGVDSDGDGANENILNDDLGAGLMGMGLVAAGLGMLIGGLAAETTEPREPLPRSAFVYGPAPYTPVMGPPGTVGLSVGDPPASRTPLPELAATEQVVRLAQQVRSASARGDCAGAWAMWDQLDAVDVTYADALRAGPVMAPCPR